MGFLICEGEPSSKNNDEMIQQNNHNHHNHHHHHQQQQSSSSSSNFHHNHPSIFHASRKLKVLCAKCLQNHDPLLTNCLETAVDVRSLSKDERSQVLLALGPHPYPHTHQAPNPPYYDYDEYGKGKSLLNTLLIAQNSTQRISNNNSSNNNMRTRARQKAVIPKTLSNSIEDEEDDHLPSDTTDYPSETEMTCTVEGDDDQLSVSTNLSTATYTTWPHHSQNHHHHHQQQQQQQHQSMWTTSTMMPQSRFPKEFTSLEYVRTWLLTSQARHNLWQDNNNDANANTNSTSVKSRVAAKKVLRSNTMSAQSRKVRFVGGCGGGVVVKDSAYVGNRTPANRKSLNGKLRQSKPQSSQSSQIVSAFQPPPRQKQHPVLPHSAHIAHTNCHNNNNTSNCSNSNSNQHTCKGIVNESASDLFYKDVEIIL